MDEKIENEFLKIEEKIEENDHLAQKRDDKEVNLLIEQKKDENESEEESEDSNDEEEDEDSIEKEKEMRKKIFSKNKNEIKEKKNKEDVFYICSLCKQCGEFKPMQKDKYKCQTCGDSYLAHLPNEEDYVDNDEDYLAEYADDF